MLLVDVAIIFLIMTVQVHPVDAFTTTAASPSSNNSSKKTIVDNNAAANTNHNDPFRLGYVTDVEGNIDYFLNYVVNHSQVLKIQYWDTKTLTLAFQQNNDNYYFVYGGDAVDKGPGDIRLVRALVDLKHRYPDRVYLLVGNRDLNKLRLVAELAEDDLQRRKIEEIPPPHWDPNAPSLYEYLTEVAAKEKIDIATANTRVNRLHYMLIHTLGCPNTFEFRREELSILRENKSITDDEVVDSFRSEIEGEGGSLFDYLSLGTVAVVIGNTLFCHGAVDRHTMGYVPPLNSKFENPKTPPQGRYIDNVVEWTEALNDYLQKGLDDFRKRPYWNKERTSRGGEALMALQNRSAMWGRSIISNCYGDGGCITTAHAAELRKKQVPTIITDPLVFENISSDPMDPVVSNWLLKNGIQRVVVGHKPTGDSPAALSSDYTGGVEIVSADTSFSDTSYADNRGQAVSVVEVVGATENQNNQLHLHGILQTGQTYDSWFPVPNSRHDDDRKEQQQNASSSLQSRVKGDVNLGKHLLNGGWWVKASYYNEQQEEEYYCLARGKGRCVEYQYISKRQFQLNTKQLYKTMTREQLQDAINTAATTTAR